MSILVAGHYCHDTLLSNDGEHRALGGSAAYASAVLAAFGEPHEVAAKVGADFLYADQVTMPPIIEGEHTTSFVDDYRSGERRGRVLAVCAPLRPADLRGRYDLGIACAIAGEIPQDTLARMREICRVLLADAQGLLRDFSSGGEVRLRSLSGEAPLDFLKASRREAALLDLPSLRRKLTLLITDGPRGCTVLTASEELHVPAFAAVERDPTGAGDCFLAGFAVGLSRSLTPLRAARLGAFCGARAVEHVGIPRFTEADVRAALEAA